MEKIIENSNTVKSGTSEEKGIRSWIRRHKKIIIIVGSSLAAVCGGLLLYHNREFFEGLLSDSNTKKEMTGNNLDNITCKSNVNEIIEQDSMKTGMDIPDITEKLVEKVEATADTECSKTINDGLPFFVNGTIRNLHEGWTASQEKIEEAQKLGIVLGPNQTIVDSFYKNVA